MVLSCLKQYKCGRKIGKAWRFIEKLIKRRLPTEAHKNCWKDFERILHIRSTMCMVFWMVHQTMAFLPLGSSNSWFVKRSHEFIEEEGSKANKSASLEALSILSWLLPIWLLIGWVLFIVSYWKPIVSRTYMTYYLIAMMLRWSAP